MNKWKLDDNGGKSTQYSKSTSELADFFNATGRVDESTVSNFDMQFESNDTYTKKMHFKKRMKCFSTFAVVLLLIFGVGYYFIGVRTYDITLSLNDGTGEEIVLSSNFGKYVGFPSDIDREGYHLVGWVTDAGEEWEPTEDRVLGNVNLIARWQINEVNISYNAGEGECDVTSQTVNYEDEFKMPISNRKGYTFLGWSSNSASSTAEYPVNQFVSGLTADNTNSLNLYAVYKENTYTVTCHTNNGRGNTVVSYTITSSSVELGVPEFYIDSQYYEFEGWYSNEATSMPFVNDLLDDPRNVDVYAKWKFNYDYSNYTELREVYLSENVDQTISVGNEKGIIIIGQSGKKYNNVNILIEEGDSPVHIILKNVNITGNSTQATIYSDSSRQIFIVSEIGSNHINAPENKNAIYTPNANLYFVGSSSLTVKGADGIHGTSGILAGENGNDGTDGTVAIVSKNIIINKSNTFNAYGGNGGNGGNGCAGTNGESKAQPERTQWSQGTDGENGSDGTIGGSGGNGGNGASAIQCEYIIAFSNITVKSGNSGNGGNGANGGNGGNGANGGDSWDFVTSTGGDGGNGGKGASGGNGGNGGDVYKAIVSDSRDILFVSSSYGNIGQGGSAGNGGHGGSGGSGGQGYNWIEADNNPDKKGNDGISYYSKYASDGVPGTSGTRR